MRKPANAAKTCSTSPTWIGGWPSVVRRAVPVTFSTQRRDARLRPEIGAHENDPGGRRGRPKPQTHMPPGHVAGPLHLDRFRNGLLTTFLNSFHDSLIS